MSAGTTRDGTTRDSAIAAQGERGGGRILLIILAFLLVFALGGGALYWLSTSYGTSASGSANKGNKARSYRTLARTELRGEPNQAARLVVSLREATTVSGVPAGNQDGVEWLEITAVDGTKGFAPKTLFKELGPATAATEIRGGTRRLIVSVTVNLRETPSLSGRILGVAEGGTRFVSDGSIQSEGEDWLRVPLDGQTTVFIMQRFTTSDDDGGSSDGIEGGTTAIGVRGFATQIANVQATPLPDARVVRALQLEEEVRIIGQTNAGRAWYVLRLSDGSQGFAPREAIRIDPNANRWVYPDGTVAPGPNIPKGSTVPVVAGAQRQGPVVRRPATGTNRTGTTGAQNTRQGREGSGSGNTGSNQPSSVPVDVPNTPTPTPTPTQPVEAPPVPGPQ
jgi:hypothetical protein